MWLFSAVTFLTLHAGERSNSPESSPFELRCFSGGWVAFGIACFYESLMENTLIEARAFYDLAKAADWLTIPVEVLMLKDKPALAES